MGLPLSPRTYEIESVCSDVAEGGRLDGYGRITKIVPLPPLKSIIAKIDQDGTVCLCWCCSKCSCKICLTLSHSNGCTPKKRWCFRLRLFTNKQDEFLQKCSIPHEHFHVFCSHCDACFCVLPGDWDKLHPEGTPKP